jgi:hypothetical protein
MKKFFFDFCNFPVKALRQESRWGNRDFVATRVGSPFRTTSDAREGLG